MYLYTVLYTHYTFAIFSLDSLCLSKTGIELVIPRCPYPAKNVQNGVEPCTYLFIC